MSHIIEPAFASNNVAIYMACSDLYAPYVGVVVSSIVQNSSSQTNYDILVLETDISSKNKSAMLEIVDGLKNFSLRFVDISETMDKYTFKVSGHHSKYNFYRLTAPEILSKYDKVIYLDSDLVVNADLSELYNLTLDDNYVAAARCIGMIAGYIRIPDRKKYIDDVLKLDNPMHYFNSGVMLMNLSAIRRDFSCSQFLEMSSGGEWMFCDQCVLNSLFRHHVLYLPQEWNVLCHTPNYENEKYLPSELYEEYIHAHEHPKISHFAGNNLPIQKPNADMYEYYWKYAENTPFYGLLLGRMESEIDKRIENDIQKRFSRSDDIAIFVSRRIDINSAIVPNPIYHPIRCGAIFDTTPSKIPGDNTGNNISGKRNSFCELTVQYWAWKNYNADYYGLCHFRRYLSFSDSTYSRSLTGTIDEKALTTQVMKKYSLLDQEKIKDTVHLYDGIVAESFDASLCPKPRLPHDTVYEMWTKQSTLVSKDVLDLTIQLVKEMYPIYYPAMCDYLNSKDYTGYNCFVLKKELFFQMCEFQFHILFELERRVDMSSYTGNMLRTPGYMGELLYATFFHWLKTQGCYRILEKPLVFFENTVAEPSQISTPIPPKKGKRQSSLKAFIKSFLKKCVHKIFPAYRVALRNEVRLQRLESLLMRSPSTGTLNLNTTADRQIQLNRKTLTSDPSLSLFCFANELHETHKASFLEFKYCHTGKSVVIVATGPSMKYYKQLPGMPHIGVNAAFKNENIKLDYYFTTDYENRNGWFQDLKNYDFIKFFGQYSNGIFRDRFQIPEQIVQENHARKFFQGAPSEDIHINIEYYPLMGFYSIAFQALHFALYTNAKNIYLVGCDCSADGYFDGTKQIADVTQPGGIPIWVKGYQKLKEFAERFYPETEIISINPVGLKGLFRDVYTESYLEDHPEFDRSSCEILEPALYEEETK